MEDFLRLWRLARDSFSSSSCSTSRISSPTPSSGLIARPSRNNFTPKTANSTAAARCVKRSGMRVGTAWPRTAERTVMTISAENAAEKTTRRGWRMAISAATRNVLSPISEKMIIIKESMKEWKGWMTPPASPSSMSPESDIFCCGLVSSGSPFEAEGGSGCGIS